MLVKFSSKDFTNPRFADPASQPLTEEDQLEHEVADFGAMWTTGRYLEWHCRIKRGLSSCLRAFHDLFDLDHEDQAEERLIKVLLHYFSRRGRDSTWTSSST